MDTPPQFPVPYGINQTQQFQEDQELAPDYPFVDRRLYAPEIRRINRILRDPDWFNSDLRVDNEMSLYDILDSWETLTYGQADHNWLINNYEGITGVDITYDPDIPLVTPPDSDISDAETIPFELDTDTDTSVNMDIPMVSDDEEGAGFDKKRRRGGISCPLFC